jgi:hypothetical protein
MPELADAADLVDAVLRLAEASDVDDDLEPRLGPNLADASPPLTFAEHDRAGVDENLCAARALLKLEQLLEDCR